MKITDSFQRLKASLSLAMGGTAGGLWVWLVLFGTGCTQIAYHQQRHDGTRIEFNAVSLFSNSTLKGLTVDGTTKTTTNGLRLTAGETQPNPESITATGEAIGSLIGTAVKTAK